MTKLLAFVATVADMDDFLYSNSVDDIAALAGVEPAAVRAFLLEYNNA